MPLRAHILAAGLGALAAFPANALARDVPVGDVADALADPAIQESLGRAISAMSEALLDTRVGPLARAMGPIAGDGPWRDLPPDARLGDVAGPQARRVSREISRRVPEMMGSVAGMAGAIEDMLPELKATARRMKDALPRH